MKKLLTIAGISFIILIFLAGCGPSYIAVGVRPQAPAYVRPMPPGPNYIWVEGEWISNGRGYAYRKGYWMLPRRRYHQYIPGNWEHGRKGWHWVPGRWR